MLTQHLTMRASLGITIVIMGLLGLALALATGEVYRRQTLDNHRAAMAELLRLKTDDVLHELEAKSRDLALAIQSEPLFQRAFAARDTTTLSRLMDNQFHQYFETANVIKIEKLRAFDIDFGFVAESVEGSPLLAGGKILCPALIQQARARQGPARLQTISDLCPVVDRLYHAVIVPIGGLRPKGYLQIFIDPIHGLAGTGQALGMPVRITLASGQVIYKSDAWFPPQDMERTLVAEYPLETRASGRVMTLAVMEDTQALHEKLSMTRYMVMMAAGLVTLLVIAVAMLVLQHTTLRPLMALHEQLRSVRKDRTRLSETLTPSGTLEIKELAQDFNALSAELGDLHRMLERQAFTDTLTDLPNRSHFHERLQQSTAPAGVTGSPFALFVMDLDRFKEVNDSFGHDIGDQLLKQVSTRLHGVLRRSDVFMRLDQETAAKMEDEIIARLGGDEFAAIVPGVADDKSAVQIAQKFIAVMQQPFMVGMHRFNVGVSIGIALYPQHGVDPMTLLRESDV
ncbi:MAG: diguanylate cyclase, partial [Pseudomonadota bacterium]